MEIDDNLVELDQVWLSGHRSELWTAAQTGHVEHGRGAVLVIFEEVRHDEIVIAYAARPHWPNPTIATQIAQYNPATEMVVMCLGRLDDPKAQVEPRAYLIQYL